MSVLSSDRRDEAAGNSREDYAGCERYLMRLCAASTRALGLLFNTRTMQLALFLADTFTMPQRLKQSGSGLEQRLADLLSSLDLEAELGFGQRSDTRRSIHMPVSLGVMAGGYKPLYRGWATDLSQEGIGLLTEHDVPMGAVLHVSLDAGSGKPLLLPIRICYVSQLMSMTYRIGGIFSFNDSDPRFSRLSA